MFKKGFVQTATVCGMTAATTYFVQERIHRNSSAITYADCRNKDFQQGSGNTASSGKSEILFLGTGSSLGTPVALHLMNPDPSDPRTLVSREAARGDPRHNRNYRCNPCIMVRHRPDEEVLSEKSETNIVVDVGKTFREASVRWFPEHRVQSVDAILLTHGHADAIFGLDDIRNVQQRPPGEPPVPMDVFLSPECLAVVQRVFFYLFPRDLAPGEVPRMVSTVQWRHIQPGTSFRTHSLDVLPFAVKHGEDMESMGFIFGGRDKDKVCYISDISRMLPESLALIQAQGALELLIIDALAQGYEHPTHYSVEQAIEMCRILRPRRALLVGMGSQIEHHSTNRELRKLLTTENLDVQLAYDGMTCQVDL